MVIRPISTLPSGIDCYREDMNAGGPPVREDRFFVRYGAYSTGSVAVNGPDVHRRKYTPVLCGRGMSRM